MCCRARSRAREKRYQFVERVLGNPKTDCDAVMASFAGQVAGALAAAGETLIVMMDQSHINDLNEVLMVSLNPCLTLV